MLKLTKDCSLSWQRKLMKKKNCFGEIVLLYFGQRKSLNRRKPNYGELKYEKTVKK